MNEKIKTTRCRDWCFSQEFFTSETLSKEFNIKARESFLLCKKFVNDGTIEFHGFEEKVDGDTGQCRNIYKPKNKPSTYDFKEMQYVVKADIPTEPVDEPMLYIRNGVAIAIIMPTYIKGF